jgi:hypothetical protein
MPDRRKEPAITSLDYLSVEQILHDLIVLLLIGSSKIEVDIFGKPVGAHELLEKSSLVQAGKYARASLNRTPWSITDLRTFPPWATA